MPTTASVISKKGGAATTVTVGETQPLTLTESSVVKLKVPHSAIKSIARVGDDLVITLMGGEVVTTKGDDLVVSYKDGEPITLKNYFAAGGGNDLVVEDQDGLWLADMLGSEGDLVVGYTPIDTVDPLLVQAEQQSNDDGAFGWWSLALGGAIWLIASTTGRDVSHPPPPRPDAPTINVDDPHTGQIVVHGQAVPGSTVRVTLPNGGGVVTVTADPVTGEYTTGPVNAPRGNGVIDATATTDTGTSDPAHWNYIDGTPPGVPDAEITDAGAGTIVVSGTAEPGSHIKVTLPDGTVVETDADPTTGAFTTDPIPAPSGDGTIDVTATDANNNESPPRELEYKDITAPTGKVTNLDLVDDVEPGIGTITKGSATNDNQPTYSGKVAAADLADTKWVFIYDNNHYLGSAAVDANGNWSYEPEVALASGPHNFVARLVDPSGNQGPDGEAWNFTLLGPAPNVPAITGIMDNAGPVTGPIGKDVPTDDTTPTVSGTAQAGVIVTVYVDGHPAGSTIAVGNGTWSVTINPPLTGDGEKHITAQAKDGAGQESVPTGDYTIILDTTAPDTQDAPGATDNVGLTKGRLNNDDTTDDNHPQISGKGEPDAVVTIKDNGDVIGSTTVDKNGNWSFTPATPLAEGEHSLTTTQTDRAGNTSHESGALTFTVDTSAVIVSIGKVIDDFGSVTGDIANGGATDDDTPTLVGRATANALVTITDENGATLDTVRANANGDWQITLATQPDGEHTYTATAQNAAGTIGTSEFTLTIDKSLPATPVIDHVEDDVGEKQGRITPNGVTDDTTPTLYGVNATPGHIIKVYDVYKGKTTLLGSTTVQADGTWNYTPLTTLNEGEHKLQVSATNPLGTESLKADFTLTIDTTPPDSVATISSIEDDTGISATDFYTSDNTLLINVSVSKPLGAGEKVQVSIDNGAHWLDTVSSGGGYLCDARGTRLDDGTYIFKARVIDAAGNTGRVTQQEVTIDTVGSTDKVTDLALWDDVPPYIGPIARDMETNDTVPTYSGKVVDRGVVSVNIYDRDVNGHDTYLGSALVNPATLAWSFEPSPALSGGRHNFIARPVDRAGNEGPESDPWIFTVLATPPLAPAITLVMDDSGPVTGPLQKLDPTDDKTPVISGTAQPGIRVEVYVNNVKVGETVAQANGTWSVTTSDLSLLGGDGIKNITAKAIDGAGQESVPTGIYPIELDTTPPVKQAVPTATDNYLGQSSTPTYTGPIHNNDTTDDNQPVLSGQGEAGAKVSIKDNGVQIGTAMVDNQGNWSYKPTTPLVDGEHAITTTQTDKAGNTSQESDALHFTVDRGPVTVSIIKVIDNYGLYTGDIANGKATDDDTPTLVGKATANAWVTITDEGGTPLGSVQANALGDWEHTLTTQTEGTHTYTATAQNAAGTTHTVSFTLVIDKTPSDVPVIDHAVDDVGEYKGPLASGDTTDDVTPTLYGTLSGPHTTLGLGTSGDLVRIYDTFNGATTLLGSATVDANGNWNYTPTTVLTQGIHNLQVSSVDPVGNESVKSSAFTLTIDTTAPLAKATIVSIEDDTGESATDFITSDQTLLIHLSLDQPLGAGDKVQISLDNGVTWKDATGSGTSYQYDARSTPPLDPGTYTFKARVTDLATNVDLSKVTSQAVIIEPGHIPTTVTIDSIWDDFGPETGVVASGDPTDDATPELRGTLSDLLGANQFLAIYRTDNGANSVRVGTVTTISGTHWSFTDEYGGMTENHVYAYTAKVESVGGGASDPSREYSMQFVGISPVTPTIMEVYDDYAPGIGPVADNGWTNDATPKISGTINGDLGADGHVVVYRSDGAGNVSSGTATVTGRDWSFNDSGLEDLKTYTYTAKVVNAAGAGRESNAWLIHTDFGDSGKTVTITDLWDDVTPNTGRITNGGESNDGHPELRGTISADLDHVSGEVVAIYRNDVLVGTVTSVTASGTTFTWSFEDPTGGMLNGTTYTYKARVVDSAQNEGDLSNPYSMKFVDIINGTTQTTIMEVYDDQTPVTGPVDNNGYTNDTTPKISGTISADLNHATGEVVAIYRNDGTNNVRIGTVTTVTPSGTKFAWSIDDSGLEDGKTYTYTAQVENAAGHSPVSDGWTIHVDTTPWDAPNLDQVIDNRIHTLPLASGPIANGGWTDDLTPTFKGSGAEPNNLVRIYDGTTLVGSAMADASGNWTLTLRLGSQDNSSVLDDIIFKTKTYTARCVDLAGNESADSNPITFTIDNEAPRLSLTITDVRDNVGPEQGSVPNQSSRAYTGTTDDPTPEIKGMIYLELTPGVKTPTPARTDHGDLVYIFMSGNDGSSLIDSVSADPSGYWSYQAHNLASGVIYNYYTRVVNAAGVGSGQSNPLTLTVDASAILTQQISGADNAKYYAGGTGGAGTLQNGVDIIATSATGIGKSAWVHGIGTDTTGTIAPTGQHDMVMGGGSNDLIGIIGTNFTSISGGVGTDTLAFEASNLTLDLTALGYRVSGFERFDLNNQVNHANAAVSDPTGQFTGLTQGNTLKLTLADVFNQADNPYMPVQKMTILGDGNSTVNLTDAGWAKTSTPETVGGVTYDVWHNAGQGSSTLADLLIQQGVHVNHI